MKNKTVYLFISLIIAILSGAVLIAGVFDLSTITMKENPLDYSFYILFTILFWFSAAYLTNQILGRFVWGKLLSTPVGDSSKNWLQDFLSSVPNTIALGFVLFAGFRFQLNLNWLILLIAVLLIMTIIRPKLLSLFTSDLFSQSKPFNVGDWISVKSKTGNEIARGEVFDISRGSVFIKTEENNLIFVTMDVLADSLIENFWSFANHTKFKLKFCIDSEIPVDRAKRILLAGTLQGIEGENLMKEPAPEVLISDVTEHGILYEIGFWIKPWYSIKPGEAKDRIYTKILEHLNKSGISLAAPKLDLFHASMPKRFTDVENINDRIEILKKVDLFDVLNYDELEILAKNLVISFIGKDQTIIKQSDTGQSMYILIEGIMDVYVKDEAKELLVGKLTPGDFFGEMSLLTGEPRSATIRARSEALVFELDKSSLAPILEKRKTLADEFGKVITRRQSLNVEKLTLSKEKHLTKFDQIVNKIVSFFHLK